MWATQGNTSYYIASEQDIVRTVALFQVRPVPAKAAA